MREPQVEPAAPLAHAAAHLREAAALAEWLFAAVAQHFSALGRLAQAQVGQVEALSGAEPDLAARLRPGLVEIGRTCARVIESLQQEDRMQQHLAAALALLDAPAEAALPPPDPTNVAGRVQGWADPPPGGQSVELF